jgi:hypothetical protein
VLVPQEVIYQTVYAYFVILIACNVQVTVLTVQIVSMVQRYQAVNAWLQLDAGMGNN